MENKLYVSPSPHIHGGDSISKNMYGVLIALVPAFLVSLYFFGLGALIVTVASVFFCVLFEYLIQKFLMKKEPTIYDGSAILTGVLLAGSSPSVHWQPSVSVRCRSAAWATIFSTRH